MRRARAISNKGGLKAAMQRHKGSNSAGCPEECSEQHPCDTEQDMQHSKATLSGSCFTRQQHVGALSPSGT